MDILRQAVAIGFRSARRYRTEPALAPLRDRDDFRLLISGSGDAGPATRPRRPTVTGIIGYHLTRSINFTEAFRAHDRFPRRVPQAEPPRWRREG